MHDATVIETVRRHAVPVDLESAAQRLLEAIDPSVSMVLIGEATHGTQEFYRIRADLTRALIRQRGFNVRRGRGRLARCLPRQPMGPATRDRQHRRGGARRFHAISALDVAEPRGRAVPPLAALRECGRRPDARERDSTAWICTASIVPWRVSSSTSTRSIPAAASRARQGYACFDAFGEDVQLYGYAASLNIERSCEDEVVEQLVDLRRRAAEYAKRDGRIAADEYFVAEQNARVVRDAETYYRAMFRGGAESWNVRDRHMMTTLEASARSCRRAPHRPPRAVVWAHNSHLGDARATSMADIGELNLGQLVRERFGSDCCSIGMTTHEGEVTAAHEWDEPAALAYRSALAAR